MIERDLRWRDVGSAHFTWSDCWAVMTTLPFDAPLRRAQEPDNWVWADPFADLVANMAEAAILYKSLMKSQHKLSAKKVPRIPRPWDKEKTKLVADAMPIDELRKKLGFSI